MGGLMREQIEQAAFAIKEFLEQNELFQGVSIHFNGKRLMSGWDYWMYVLGGDEEREEICDEEYVLQECEMEEYIPEADEETLLAMSYEGEFYSLMNYGEYPDEKGDFEELLKEYGLRMYPVGECRLLLE